MLEISFDVNDDDDYDCGGGGGRSCAEDDYHDENIRIITMLNVIN